MKSLQVLVINTSTSLSMKYYLRIYKALFSINLSNLLVHRANFYNSMLSSIAWAFFSILSIVILTTKTPQVFGWKREEILLLTAGFSILVGIFHMLFSRNFEKVSELIHFGQFDTLLTKPSDAQFLMSTRYINYTSLFRILAGIIMLEFLVYKYSIVVTFTSILGFVVLLLVGLVIDYSMWLLVITTTIWFTRLSNLPDFMYSFTSVGRFPQEIYKETMGYLFLFFLPLTLIITIPVKALLGRALLGEVLLIILFALALFLISRKFWLFALKHYTSAGG